MGSGIAQVRYVIFMIWTTKCSEKYSKVAAQTGHQVTLVEVNADLLKKAESNITNNVSRVAKKIYKDKPDQIEKFIADTRASIKGSTDVTGAVKDSDLVIEAIVENLDIKHKLFKSLDEAAPTKTIFASNTSSLAIGDIASVTKRKDRFGGLHFFNPVPVMKLVEVIRTSDTTDATYNELLAFGKAVGKSCVTCKDTPGFIVNRLLVPYLMEAIRLYERGK